MATWMTDLISWRREMTEDASWVSYSGMGAGKSCSCTLPSYPAYSQASSAVKARMGASRRHRALKIMVMAVCVARRRTEEEASQYRRSLVVSTYRADRSLVQNWLMALNALRKS